MAKFSRCQTGETRLNERKTAETISGYSTGIFDKVTSFSVSIVERAACSFRTLIEPQNKLAACSTEQVSPISGKFVAKSEIRREILG
jgi:hypothetical protein